MKHFLFLSIPSEIVDGNCKMTLGMIWTIILRFAIQDITVEGEFWKWNMDELEKKSIFLMLSIFQKANHLSNRYFI